jgi:16S rRNA (guanine527-N7)-methyltransferase
MVDMGSGAGLPGVPLAVAFPEAWVALVEPTRRRVAFLELAVQELGLRNTEVMPGTMAQFAERRHLVDVCLARAFGSPNASWTEGARVLRRGGRVLYYAGRSWSEASSDLPPGVRARICAPSRGSGIGPIVALFEIDPSQEQPDGPDALT